MVYHSKVVVGSRRVLKTDGEGYHEYSFLVELLVLY